MSLEAMGAKLLGLQPFPLVGNTANVAKGDLTVSDLSTNGGYLAVQQYDTFVKDLIKLPRILKVCRFVTMDGVEQQIDAISFPTRILKAGTEGAALDAADRSEPTTRKVNLVAKLYKASIRVSYDALQAAIPGSLYNGTATPNVNALPPFGNSFANLVMSQAVEAIGRDFEEALIEGDDTSLDAFLAVQDGLLVKATSHTYAHSAARANRTLWKSMLRVLPAQYRNDLTALRYFVSPNADMDYRDAQGDRGGTTLTEEQAIGPKSVMTYQGIPILSVAMMPEDQGGSSNASSALLTKPSNIIVGIHRNVFIDLDRDVDTSQIKIVISLKVAFAYEQEDAVVKATGILVG